MRHAIPHVGDIDLELHGTGVRLVDRSGNRRRHWLRLRLRRIPGRLCGERPRDGQQSDQRREEKSAQIHSARKCMSRREGGRNSAGLECRHSMSSTPFGMTPTVFWIYVSAAMLSIIGLIRVFREVPQQQGIDKIMPFGRLFFAIPMAVFASEHFTARRLLPASFRAGFPHTHSGSI